MPDTIIKAAQRFAKSRDTADLGGATPWAIESEMIAYAKAHSAKGESTEAAVTRLCEEDDVMKSLARASYWSSTIMQRTLRPVDQLRKLREHHAGVQGVSGFDMLAKRQELAEALDAVAKAEQREGESFYDSYDRLMKSDPQFQAAYATYVEAKE